MMCFDVFSISGSNQKCRMFKVDFAKKFSTLKCNGSIQDVS